MDKQSAPPPTKMGGIMHGAPAKKPKDMRGTLARLWALTKGHRQGLGWILALSALASAAAIVSPLLIGGIVGRIDAGQPALLLLGLLLGLYVLDWLTRFLQQFFMASIGQKMILHIRVSLFAAMKKLPLAFFDRRQHGELMSRLTNDVDNISVAVSDGLAQLFVYAFTILGVFGLMLSLNLPLTGVTLVAVALVLLLTRTVTKRTRRLFAEQQKILGSLNGQVEESVSGLSMVKAYGREADMVARFEEKNEALRAVATRALIWSGYLMPVTNVVNNLSYVAVAVISGVMAARGTVTVALISSFLLYSRQFTRPFIDIANIYNNFQSAVAGAERVIEVLDETPEPPDRPGALPLEHVRGEIVFSHVTFGYAPGRPVLRDIDLTVPAGTRVAIVGETGSGKTTLAGLLTRLYDVDEGQILLDGRDVRDYRMRDLREAFGVVLQDTALFGVSVRDNIAYGKPGVPLEAVHEAARTAGADPFVRRLPDGYDTILTQGGAALSQGQRQLLTIARAVLTDAPILILDEATSSVDTVTEQKIRAAMLQITRGRTSFIIAHRLSTIRDSDLILVMEDGRITERGTHDALMARGGRYAEMYSMQITDNG